MSNKTEDEDSEEVDSEVARSVLSKQIDSYHNLQLNARQTLGLLLSSFSVILTVASLGSPSISFGGDITEPAYFSEYYSAVGELSVLILASSLFLGPIHLLLGSLQLFRQIWPERFRPIINEKDEVSRYTIIDDEMDNEIIKDMLNSNSETLSELYETQENSYYNLALLLFVASYAVSTALALSQGDLTIIIFISLMSAVLSVIFILDKVILPILHRGYKVIFENSIVESITGHAKHCGDLLRNENKLRLVFKTGESILFNIFNIIRHTISELQNRRNRWAIAPFPYFSFILLLWGIIILGNVILGFYILFDQLAHLIPKSIPILG